MKRLLNSLTTVAPAGVSCESNRLDIFALGESNDMQHLAWRGGAWPPQAGWELNVSLRARAGEKPAARSRNIEKRFTSRLFENPERLPMTKSFIASIRRTAIVLLPLVAPLSIMPFCDVAAQQAESEAAGGVPARFVNRDVWHDFMARLPTPKKGCFTASFPEAVWKEVPCTAAPNRPYPPAAGQRPQTVGNGNDISAGAAGRLSSATGSFDKVTGVRQEYETNSGNADVYSLQLNTNTFPTSACNGAATPSKCQGWQQFVYSNSGVAFIQYWLIGYATTCPSGWNTYQNSCYRNGASSASVSPQSITNLAELKLTGQSGSGSDTVTFLTSSNNVHAANQDSILGLSKDAWNDAEFNVFGDCCGSMASFTLGTTLVVRTAVNDGSRNPPSCLRATGFTGETNNLNFVNPPCAAVGGEAPAIVFTEGAVGHLQASSAAFYQTSLDRVIAFVVGSNGHLYDTFWNGQQWVWEDQETPPNHDVKAVSSPSATYQTSLDRVIAFVVGSDGNLYDTFWNGQKWVWEDRGTPPNPANHDVKAVSSPSATYQKSLDRVIAFVVGSDGNLYDTFWNGQKWVWDPGTPPNPANHDVKAVSSPSATYQKSLGRVIAFVVGSDDHLYDTFWNGQKWVWEDQETP
ncbi:MAG: hypothetical protein ACLQFI_02695 [Methylocella sp.]